MHNSMHNPGISLWERVLRHRRTEYSSCQKEAEKLEPGKNLPSKTVAFSAGSKNIC